MRRGGRAARVAAQQKTGQRQVSGQSSGTARAPALPDDATLTASGYASAAAVDKSARVLVIACGALAREILALRDQGFGHLDLHCLPAILHNSPQDIPAAVEAAVRARREGYGQVFVAYADCGTGGDLARLCARLGVRMIEGPHCYAFFEGLSAFAAHGEIDAFYLTDFLARQFDAFVTRPLGLDRHPELRDTYFAQYKTLVYLAQTEDPALEAAARTAADQLGLRYERRFTGLAPFADALRAEIAVDD